MRYGIFLFFALRVFAPDQQLSSIRVESNLQTAPPMPSIASSSAPIGPAIGSPPLPPQVFVKIDSLMLDEASHTLSYSVRLANESKTSIALPVSQDGSSTAMQCANSPLKSITLSYMGKSGHGTQPIFSLYGCGSVQKTMITLETGNWIHVTGVKRIAIPDGKLSSATLSLLRVTDHYSTENGRTRVDSITDDYGQFEFNVSPAPHAVKSPR